MTGAAPGASRTDRSFAPDSIGLIRHRFTLIAHALLSGRWSTTAGDVGCTWAYTVDKRLLSVTRGTVTQIRRFPAGDEPISMTALQDQLPSLALSIGNAIEYPA